jgi:hypothetical protein
VNKDYSLAAGKTGILLTLLATSDNNHILFSLSSAACLKYQYLQQQYYRSTRFLPILAAQIPKVPLPFADNGQWKPNFQKINDCIFN